MSDLLKVTSPGTKLVYLRFLLSCLISASELSNRVVNNNSVLLAHAYEFIVYFSCFDHDEFKLVIFGHHLIFPLLASFTFLDHSRIRRKGLTSILRRETPSNSNQDTPTPLQFPSLYYLFIIYDHFDGISSFELIQMEADMWLWNGSLKCLECFASILVPMDIWNTALLRGMFYTIRFAWENSMFFKIINIFEMSAYFAVTISLPVFFLEKLNWMFSIFLGKGRFYNTVIIWMSTGSIIQFLRGRLFEEARITNNIQLSTLILVVGYILAHLCLEIWHFFPSWISWIFFSRLTST